MAMASSKLASVGQSCNLMHCLNRERREKDKSKKGTNESDER
jgi:hypothetical protein